MLTEVKNLPRTHDSYEMDLGFEWTPVRLNSKFLTTFKVLFLIY